LIAASFPDIDGDGYFTVGVIEGSTTGLDIDAILPGFANGDLRFDAIQLRDDQDGSNCSGPTTGADIDAVCAISSMPPVDCRGVARGTAMLDACGECLELTDPNFNQSCADCAGVPNGTYVIDSCGTCLPGSSPEFNAECTDCAGILFGNSVVDNCGLCLLPGDQLFNQTCFDCLGNTGGFAIIDSCGVCLLPTDPEFNQSCADCAGTPNGPAILDSCGVCLTPDNLLFNQSCVEQKPLFVPTVFSPNGDGINDILRIFKSTIVRAQVKRCRIYDRWGGLIAETGPLPFSDGAELWDGEDAGPGVYAYTIELTYQNGGKKQLRGIVTLLR
jgi:gliding motility-associated-like protein